MMNRQILEYEPMTPILSKYGDIRIKMSIKVYSQVDKSLTFRFENEFLRAAKNPTAVLGFYVADALLRQ